MRIFVFLLLCLTGFSARAENETAEKLRFPVAAGVYYPAAAEETKSRIDDLLAAARGRFRTGTGKSPKAVIVPHDSLFSESGRVAAAAYAALMKIKPFVRRVVIVASPQHGKHFGVMLSSARYWTLPSGQRFETDGALIAKLKQIQGIDYDDAAFEAEEAIEVQLPFIAAVFRPDVKIVPILAGDAGIDQISDVIDLVWGGSETAIVFASDMAKGENAAKTAKKDERTARILEKKEDVPLGKDRLSAPRPVEGLLAYLRETGGEINRLDLQSGTDLFSGERIRRVCRVRKRCRSAKQQGGNRKSAERKPKRVAARGGSVDCVGIRAGQASARAVVALSRSLAPERSDVCQYLL